MSAEYAEYSVDAEIATFFAQTSATRSACDVKAKELAGGDVVPVDVQGVCSYSVYAGKDLEYVVQFRLGALALNADVISLASTIYGKLAPTVSYRGTIGDRGSSLCIYLMSRVRGITYLNYILAHGYPADSAVNVSRRKVLLGDVAHFMALSWKGAQVVSDGYRTELRGRYIEDLENLHENLPERFKRFICSCLDSIDAIMALPMVLLHKDFGDCNIMVDEVTCHLVGVIDWAEAEICPFGLNLHSLQPLTGRLHLRNGWTRLEDYDVLQELFWTRFVEEVCGLSEETLRTIKLARVLGLLLSAGFPSRLSNQVKPKPIGNDEQGRYKTLSLEGFLIDPKSKFDGLGPTNRFTRLYSWIGRWNQRCDCLLAIIKRE
ncbi:hypothetical protein ANO11243_009530 [Dothideomycetidae sp. 11243]|nr:hypothetical protein ANO11243_009530 [fungal sp. No.11243]